MNQSRGKDGSGSYCFRVPVGAGITLRDLPRNIRTRLKLTYFAVKLCSCIVSAYNPFMYVTCSLGYFEALSSSYPLRQQTELVTKRPPSAAQPYAVRTESINTTYPVHALRPVGTVMKTIMILTGVWRGSNSSCGNGTGTGMRGTGAGDTNAGAGWERD